MARLIRCIEGHVFDANQHTACPVCGATVVPVPTPEAPAPAAATVVAAAPIGARRLGLVGGIAALVIVAGGGVYWATRGQPPAPAPSKVSSATPPSTTPAPPAPPSLPKAEPTRPAAPASPTAAPATAVNPPAAPRNAAPSVPPRPVPHNPSMMEVYAERVEPMLVRLQKGGSVGSAVMMMSRQAFGVALVHNNNAPLGLPFVERAANGGMARAQGMLGHGYWTGAMGMQKNPASARAWSEKAAAGGDEEAQFDLGSMDMHDGNVAAASKHFLAAYLGGYPPAVDMVHKAAGGDQSAKTILARLNLDAAKLPAPAYELYYSRLKADPAGMRRQLVTYQQQHIGAAIYLLATMMWNGEGGPKDQRAAVDLFLQAAGAGYPTSLTFIGAAELGVLTEAPYEAAALLVINQSFAVPAVVSGLDVRTLYGRAKQALKPQQAEIIRDFEELMADVAPQRSLLNITKGR